MQYRICTKDQIYVTSTKEHNTVSTLHINRFMEIVIVTEGALHMQIGGTAYRIPKGHAVFVQSFEPHDFQHKEDYTCYVLAFQMEFAPLFYQFLREHHTDSPMIELRAKTYAYLLMMLPKETEEFLYRDPSLSESDKRCFLNGMHAQAILNVICQEFLTLCPFMNTVRKSNDVYLQVMEYLLDHPTEPQTLTSVAEALHLHPENLSRIFRQHAGVSFTNFVQYMSVCRAASLLREDMPISDVVYQSGFGSIRTFNRIFKKYTGITPTAFQQKRDSLDVFPYIYAKEPEE